MNWDRNHWYRKFGYAFRGVRVGMWGQSSFRVHLPMSAAVTLLAVTLNVNLLEWCVLVLCIGLVLSAELFNSALEHLAKAITDEVDPHVRDALDISSGGVLLLAWSAAIVGLIILGFRLGVLLGWWGGYLLV